MTCAEHFATRDDALRAHATQVDPDGHWFAVPLEVQQEVWPTEEFELARSLVAASLPETDLFAGLRELAADGTLDELCRRVPERDGDGALVLAHRGEPPLPPAADASGEELSPRSTAPQDGDGDGDDDMREQEGHRE